jgi:hypothetical protein
LQPRQFAFTSALRVECFVQPPADQRWGGPVRDEAGCRKSGSAADINR